MFMSCLVVLFSFFFVRGFSCFMLEFWKCLVILLMVRLVDRILIKLCFMSFFSVEVFVFLKFCFILIYIFVLIKMCLGW